MSNALKDMIKEFEVNYLHEVANNGLIITKFNNLISFDINGIRLFDENDIEYRLNEMSIPQLMLAILAIEDLKKILNFEEMIK